MNIRATFTVQISLKEINHLYKTSGDSGRAGPKDVLCGLIRDSELICATRLLNYDGYWLLRNLCTLPGYRGRGFASQLLSNIQQSPSVTEKIYTLPLPHLDNFYIANGFLPLSEEQVPTGLTQVLRQSRRRHKGIRVMVMRQQLR